MALPDVSTERTLCFGGRRVGLHAATIIVGDGQRMDKGLEIEFVETKAIALKFRLLSIQFTSIRSDDECNGDVSPTLSRFSFERSRRLQL